MIFVCFESSKLTSSFFQGKNKEIIKSDITMSAFLVVYKEPVASYETLKQFRTVYPNSSLHLIRSKGGFNFSKMAKKFGATYEEFPENIYNIGPLSSYVIFLSQIFSRFQEDYVMLLEDDVRVVRELGQPMKGILNGHCIWNFFNNDCGVFHFPFFPFSNLNCGHPYTGHGGSIYNRAAFLEIASNPLVANISSIPHYIMREFYWNDRAMSALLLILRGEEAINCFFSQIEYNNDAYVNLSRNLNFTQSRDLYFRFNANINVSIIHRWKLEYGLVPSEIVNGLFTF